MLGKTPIRDESNPWKAAIMDLLFALEIYEKHHETNPLSALESIMAWNWEAGAYEERTKSLMK